MAIKNDPDGQFIVHKGRIHEEDKNIVNIYDPNIGAPKYIKKILQDSKKDIDSNTIKVGDFNTLLSKMDRSSKQNINKDIVALNNTLEEMDLLIYIEPFIPKKQNTHSFQMHMEHFQRQTTRQDTKHASTNSRKLKSYQVFSLTTRDQKPTSRKKLKNTQICGD